MTADALDSVTGGIAGGTWLAAIALGVPCTGIAYLLFFRLITNVGATRTIDVTFVIPLFEVGWGAWFLGERIDVTSVVGALRQRARHGADDGRAARWQASQRGAVACLPILWQPGFGCTAGVSSRVP